MTTALVASMAVALVGYGLTTDSHGSVNLGIDNAPTNTVSDYLPADQP
jgi:hypothetical protein